MLKADPRQRRWPIFVITVPILAAADQITKAWIRTYPEGSTIFQSGILRIVHIENSGAAFGIFQGHSTVLMCIDFLALALILFYFITLYKRYPFFRGWLGWLGLSLIFAGTTGNLIDRLNPNIGGITDFLYISIWPAFNVADSCISVGVILLAYALIFMPIKVEPQQELPK